MGSTFMFEKALAKLRAQGFTGGLHNIAMVGDVLPTDIKGGKAFGVHTFFVLTGGNQVDDIPFYPEIGQPTCIFSSVADIPLESLPSTL